MCVPSRINTYVRIVCVCVCVRERERERKHLSQFTDVHVTVTCNVTKFTIFRRNSPVQ
jgi:hypothetical protein